MACPCKAVSKSDSGRSAFGIDGITANMRSAGHPDSVGDGYNPGDRTVSSCRGSMIL
jgi:hypothetical protein